MEPTTLLELQKINNRIYNINSDFSSKKVYRKFNHLYIKQGKNLFESYQNIKSLPELNIYPSLSIKSWVLYFTQKKKITLETLLGPLLGWYLLKREYFDLDATIILDRKSGRFLLLIYRELNLVAKVRTNASTKFKNEIDNNILAREISSKNHILHVAEIKDYIYEPKSCSYYTQELIKGKSIKFSKADSIQSMFQKTADFLYEFYREQHIQLISPSQNIIEENTSSPENLNLSNKLITVNNYFTQLINQQKKCFYGKIHGDLNTDNLILDPDKKLWLIDWQESKFDYLAIDFEQLPNGGYLFDKVLKDFSSEKESIFGLNEQIFIANYTLAFRLSQKPSQFAMCNKIINKLYSQLTK